MNTHPTHGRHDTARRTVAILAPDVHIEGNSAVQKLRRVAHYRRNPRPAAYMRALAEELLPEAELVPWTGEVSATVTRADRIVLLWPDATGVGWMPIERAVFRHKRQEASVEALTGRRRQVRLSTATLLAFRARRAAEHLWLGEIATLFALLFSAPVLVAWDFAKGRR